jgi:hypothetical protein
MVQQSSKFWRSQPRVAVETLCTEVVEEREQLGLVVDLSASGLRLQRPLRGRVEGRIIQLEFELPEVDEIVWAKGEICFDQLWRGPATGGASVRTSGVRLVAAATRHLKMLRDYVMAASEGPRTLAGQEPLGRPGHWLD